jgi:hypothetical protein
LAPCHQHPAKADTLTVCYRYPAFPVRAACLRDPSTSRALPSSLKMTIQRLVKSLPPVVGPMGLIGLEVGSFSILCHLFEFLEPLIVCTPGVGTTLGGGAVACLDGQLIEVGQRSLPLVRSLDHAGRGALPPVGRSVSPPWGWSLRGGRLYDGRDLSLDLAFRRGRGQCRETRSCCRRLCLFSGGCMCRWGGVLAPPLVPPLSNIPPKGGELNGVRWISG